MNTTLRKLVAVSLVAFGIFCFLKGLPSSVTRDAANGVMPGAVASIHSDRPALPAAASVKTRAIQDIRVGQRVLAENPEISNLERRTRRAEPNFSRWLQLSLEMPKPDGSTLHIEMLRSEEWLRNQIGFVVGEIPEPSGERLGVSPPSAIPTPDFNPSSPKTENLQPKTELAPLSPLRPIFSDILYASLAAEADGAELVGLTVQMDLPELGLTGEAILTDIQTTPEIEAPIDDRDERQVVTATFHHSSGDVIDLVVADTLGERLGLSENPPSWTEDSGELKAEIGARESEISDFKSPPCGFPKTENLKPKTSGEAETIGTTSNHPFWSEDRQEFVQAGSLEIGERLQTLSGDVKVVQQKLPRPGPQPVFNLEVHDEHVYFVGEDGVLVHNACTDIGDLGEHGTKGWLKRNGYTDVGSVQNPSGHELDIVARHRDGTLTIFEVKTSISGVAPALSRAQSDPIDFITSRLTRASGAGPWWRRTPLAVRHQASSMLTEINSGNFRRYVVEITNAGNPNAATSFRIRKWMQ